MQCSFCGKEIDIKKEWPKKPFWQKIADVFASFVNDFCMANLDSFAKEKSLAIGTLKATWQTILFVVSALITMCGFFRIFVLVENLLDRYVFLKPLFNDSVPVLTFSNTLLPFFEGAILLIISFCVACLMFKNNLEGDFESIFYDRAWPDNVFLKCPHCDRTNKKLPKRREESELEERKVSKKEQKNNAIFGVFIIIAAIIGFSIFLVFNNNWRNFLNPDILWPLAVVSAFFLFMFLWTNFRSKIFK